jgi:hypothetical protein
MLVVLIIAFIGGWIGAWLLRRRYLRRKELEHELRPPITPWVAGSGLSQNQSPYGDGVVDSVGNKEARTSNGVLATPLSALGRKGKEPVYATEEIREKPAKKRWTVSERT